MTTDLTKAGPGLRWGIVGTGAIAKAFATGLRSSRSGRLAAVGSRSVGSAERFAAEFGAASAHGSYEALFGDPGIDAVYISTPHPMHASLSIQAAEAGKHILCEKPAAMNRWEAMAVLEVVREHDVFFMEAFMYRCHPQTAKIREIIQSGTLGRIALVEAAFAFRAEFNPESRLFSHTLGGGAILDVGCYCVSMARLVAGAADGLAFAEPVRVHGSAMIGTGSRVDEWASANLEFANGIQANLFTAITVRHKNEVRIFGTDGSLVVGHPFIPSKNGGGVSMWLDSGKGAGPVEIQTSLPDAEFAVYAAEADAVARSIANRQSPEMPWDDTLGNLATLDSWRESAGLTYDGESKNSAAEPVKRRQPRVRSGAPVEKVALSGLEKPVSQLVMGVDNQRSPIQVAVMFDDFVERGGNAFDTAWQYGGGLQERLFGRWLESRGLRDDVVIIAKGAHTPRCTPEAFETQLLESLERLRVDRVEIYMLHRDNPSIPAGEFVDALNRQIEAGRIKLIGGSNWTMERVDEANAYAAANGLQGFGVLSNNLSLARMVNPVWSGCVSASDIESRRWLEANQIALLPWSSQARGFFTGRGDPADTSDAEMVRCWHAPDNFARRERAIELARTLGVAPINIALAYVLAQPFPVFPLFGPRSLRETVTSLDSLRVKLTTRQAAWLNLEAESPQ